MRTSQAQGNVDNEVVHEDPDEYDDDVVDKPDVHSLSFMDDNVY